MGSNFSRQMCCAAFGRCMKQEAEEGTEETSETKPILQALGETCINKQPPTHVLEASNGSLAEMQSLCQDQRLQPGTADDDRDTCLDSEPGGMIDSQKVAWDSADFLASAVMETKGKAEILTQLENLQEREEAGNTGETETVSQAFDAPLLLYTPQDVKLTADIGQSELASEDALCAETGLQEADVLQLMQTTGENAADPGREIRPPVETGERLVGRSLLPCAVLGGEEPGICPRAEYVEETDGAKSAETRPQFIEGAELTSPSERALLPTVQAMQEAKEIVDPLEFLPKDKAETQLASGDSCESLYLEGKSPEPASWLLDILWQEALPSVLTAEEGQSLCCTEPAKLGEAAGPSDDQERVPCDLIEDEEMMESDPKMLAAEAEQQTVMQQIMDEMLPCIEISVEETESPNVVPLLSEVLGLEEK